MSLILPPPLGLELLSAGIPFYGTDPTVFHVDFRKGRVWDGANQVELTVDDILSNTGVSGNKWFPAANGQDVLKVDTELPYTDLGLHLWKSAQNFLPDSDAPVTRTISLAANSYCMWIRGSGSCTITGTFSSAPAGAVTEGTFRKFAINATRNITFTYTGNVTFAQVELGAFPTPGIHAQATRPIDNVKPTGAFLAALQQPEITIYTKWSAPASQPGANRRFIRGSNGSTHILALGLSTTDKMNASHTASSSTSFNLTSTVSITQGGTNAYYVKIKQNDFKLSLPFAIPPETQSDNSGNVTLNQISDFSIGKRNDTGAEPLNASIEQITIWPRGLEDAEFIPFDPRPVPEIPFVDYPAIETAGGEGGTTYTISAFDGSLRTRLHQFGARIIRTDPALTGVDLANTSAISVAHGLLSWRGHKRAIFGVGGNVQIGATGTPTDILLEDLHLCPGDGAAGQVPDNRDGLTVHRIERLIIRNCVICYSIDEALGLFVNAGQRAAQVLIENCIIGPNLKQVRDANGNLYKPDEPNHNYGLLASKRVENIVVRNSLFACCRQRSPDFVVTFGGLFQNNIVYNVSNIAMAAWGSDLTTDFVGMTAAFRNNLLKAGPNSPADWLDRCQVVGRLDRGSAIYFKDNYGTDGGTFSGDTALAYDRVTLRNGSSKNSLVTSIPFGTAYDALPTATATNREDLWNFVLDRVGVRTRDGSDAIVPGDADASALTAAIVAGVKDGTLAEIIIPDDFVGYVY